MSVYWEFFNDKIFRNKKRKFGGFNQQVFGLSKKLNVLELQIKIFFCRVVEIREYCCRYGFWLVAGIMKD
jgi:hypothetical protein